MKKIEHITAEFTLSNGEKISGDIDLEKYDTAVVERAMNNDKNPFELLSLLISYGMERALYDPLINAKMKREMDSKSSPNKQ